MGPGFTLLWRSTPEPLSDAAAGVVKRFAIHQVAFGTGSAGAGALILHDARGAYADWFERHGAAAVLVRPDHVVFGVVSDGRTANGLLQRLGARVS